MIGFKKPEVTLFYISPDVFGESSPEYILITRQMFAPALDTLTCKRIKNTSLTQITLNLLNEICIKSVQMLILQRTYTLKAL